MPRYHFNIYDGISAPDIDGTELADLKAARFEAIRLASALLAEEAEDGRPGEPWTMEVTNGESHMVLRLDFRLTAFPLGSDGAESTNRSGELAT